MLWAILSGIEGNLPAYNAVLKNIQQQSVDHLYILGDLVGPRPDSEALVQRIREQTSLPAQVCIGWWEEQLFNLHGFGSDAEATQLRQHYGAEGVEQLWKAVSRDTAQWLHSLDFGFFELDCLLIHGSTLGCDDELTPETSPMQMLDRLLRSEANSLFCGRSGLTFQYQLPQAQITSTVQMLGTAKGEFITQQQSLNPRQIVGVGNVGRTAGQASYTLYNPYTNTVQFQQVVYDPFAYERAISVSRGRGFSIR